MAEYVVYISVKLAKQIGKTATVATLYVYIHLYDKYTASQQSQWVHTLHVQMNNKVMFGCAYVRKRTNDQSFMKLYDRTTREPYGQPNGQMQFSYSKNVMPMKMNNIDIESVLKWHIWFSMSPNLKKKHTQFLL